MKINRSVPPATVVPVLVYPDVRAAVAFLADAFGFVERTRIGESHRAQLAVGGDGAVIVADVGGDRCPPQRSGVTHMVRVRVVNVDARVSRGPVNMALSSLRRRSTGTTASGTAPSRTSLATAGSWRKYSPTWRRKSSAARRSALGPPTTSAPAER